MQKYTIFFILVFINTLDAKSIFEDFLASSTKDLQIKQVELSENEFDKTLIEKIRVNVGYSRFDKSDIDDEYEIRIYPKTFSQRESEEKIYGLIKNQIDASYQDAKISTLKKHYTLLIDTYFQKKSYKNTQEIVNLNKNKLDALLLATDSASDILDLSKLKYKVQNAKFDLEQQKEIYQNMLASIQGYIPEKNSKEIDQAFENIPLIETNEIVNFANQNKHIFLKTLETYTKKERALVNLAKEEMNLNKIENSLRINSLDLQYENRDTFTKSFSVGLSVEYFWPGGDMAQSAGDNLRIINAQNRLSNIEKELNYEILELISEINVLNSKLTHAKESIDKDNFYNTYQQLKNHDPFILFSLQGMHLVIKKDMIEVEQQLYSKYINLLSITNGLTKSTLFKKQEI